MFDQFYSMASLLRSFSFYFATLIPKVGSPSNLGDFRVISLVGYLYKLATNVMGKIISLIQSASMKGRLLVDEVVVVNEFVDLAKRTQKNCFILMVDFKKGL